MTDITDPTRQSPQEAAYWQKIEDELCPRCGSPDRVKCHTPATALAPECSFWRCPKCSAEWNQA